MEHGLGNALSVCPSVIVPMVTLDMDSMMNMGRIRVVGYPLEQCNVYLLTESSIRALLVLTHANCS